MQSETVARSFGPLKNFLCLFILLSCFDVIHVFSKHTQFHVFAMITVTPCPLGFANLLRYLEAISEALDVHSPPLFLSHLINLVHIDVCKNYLVLGSECYFSIH